LRACAVSSEREKRIETTGAKQDLVSEGYLHAFRAMTSVLMSQLVLKNEVWAS